MKYYLKLLSFPLLFLALYTSLSLIWHIFELPPPAELTKIVEVWFDKYGLPALFLSSILEGMLLIGSYFPGVFVIFLGVVIANSVSEAVLAVFICTLGLIIAHVLNYFMGKYGWYRLLVKFGMSGALEQSKVKLERKGLIAIPLSYWLPSMGAFTDTAAGILRLSFKKFFLYSFSSSVIWYSIAGVLVYKIGDRALEIAGGGGNSLVFLIIAIWICVLLGFDYMRKKK